MIRMYDSARTQRLVTLPQSGCPQSGCANCLSSGAGVSKPAFVPGDVIVGGFFSVHSAGKTSMTCGAINKVDGPELVEAFLYGLKNAADLNLWRGSVRLGAIAFDDCSSPDLASNIVLNFKEGNTYGVQVDPRLVNAYTGGNDAATTAVLTKLLANIPRPLLGYKPAPTALSDTEEFPFFASIVPGSTEEIQALTQLLKRMGLTHVLVVHENNNLAKDFLMHLRKMATAKGVCLAAIETDDLSSTQDIMEALQQRSQSKVILLHGGPSQYGPLLFALNRTTDAADYVVIATSAMMADSLLRNQRYKFRIIALTLKVPSIEGWNKHLRTLTPNSEGANPWLNEWYESAFNCYLDFNNQKGYSKMCRNTADAPITTAPGFKVNPYSYYVVMAVGALSRAMDKTLQRYCGSSYSTVCSRYKNVGGREKVMMEYLRDDPYLNGDLVNGYDVMYKAAGAAPFVAVNNHYTFTQ